MPPAMRSSGNQGTKTGRDENNGNDNEIQTEFKIHIKTVVNGHKDGGVGLTLNCGK